MKITVVLNGCQNDFFNQLEEVISFLKIHFNKKKVRSVIFLNDEDKILDFNNTKKFFYEINFIKIKNNNNENILNFLTNFEKNNENELYIFPSNLWGNSICTRFSCRKNGSSINEIHSISEQKETKNLIVKKMVYHGTILGEFTLKKKPFCITLGKGVFSCDLEKNQETVTIQEYNMIEKYFTTIETNNIVSCTKKEMISGLDKAKFIIACGNGAQSREIVQEIKKKAKKIGAEFGVSRPVAMSNWDNIEKIIGISGNICKSEIMIVLGVSGAGAFLAGVDKSKFIIAVNIDKNAAIMKNSDVIIIDDCVEFMNELEKKLK